jgi:sulfatase maturation enzyme AslB (radical SAM superfamily)
MNKNSKTFCILPWMHLATNASGNLRVCCNSIPGKNFIFRDNTNKPYKITDTDMLDFWHSNTMKKIRNELLNDIRPSMCERCFREEDSGVRSARQSWNEKYMFDYQTSVTPDLVIKYIDIRLGNLCNLKCRMCNPYSSNQWTEEWGLLNSNFSIEEKNRLESMNWPNDDMVAENIIKVSPFIEEIYLTGGEPTLALSQYKLFDKLIELNLSKNITLKYNTNCTNLPNKLLDYWKNFKKIKINASIDAYKDLNRYIRYPTGWELVEKNLLKFIKLEKETHIDLQIHCTVQIYNILQLDKFFDFLIERNITDIYLNILNHPEYLNIRVLPKELKELAIKRLIPYQNIKKVNSTLDYMMAEDWNHKWSEFVNYTRILDNNRNENIADLIPELRYDS